MKKKTEIFINKPAYLGYKDTDSLIVYIKTGDIFSDLAKDVEIRIYNPDFELDKPLPKGKKKKVFELMKDELGGKRS